MVVGPRLKNGADLIRIVPLSTSDRPIVQPWQIEVTLRKRLPAPFDSITAYALCDHVFNASRSRLDRFRPKRRRYGSRQQWYTSSISDRDLLRVRNGIKQGLGL